MKQQITINSISGVRGRRRVPRNNDIRKTIAIGIRWWMMRSILAAIIMLWASAAVVHAAEAQEASRIQSGYGVGHRRLAQDDVTGANQVQFDKKTVEKDNELLDLPTTQDRILGANQVESEENSMAKTIEQENARLDRELRGICRGC